MEQGGGRVRVTGRGIEFLIGEEGSRGAWLEYFNVVSRVQPDARERTNLRAHQTERSSMSSLLNFERWECFVVAHKRVYWRRIHRGCFAEHEGAEMVVVLLITCHRGLGAVSSGPHNVYLVA